VPTPRQLELPPHAWWARVAVSGGYGYLLADNADLAGWQSWLRATTGGDLAEYSDLGGGVFRAASFTEDRIETCLFVGPARDAGDWDAVKNLFAADKLSDDQRRMLLSGKSIDGLASAGPVVCTCFGGRPQHGLRGHRGRCGHGQRDRRAGESRHQLRLVHS
jgi:assimilatory nitrate reductase catalytic subunit